MIKVLENAKNTSNIKFLVLYNIPVIKKYNLFNNIHNRRKGYYLFYTFSKFIK